MGKPRLDPLAELEFQCEDCGLVFRAEPEIVEPEPDQDFHPWFYTTRCQDPECPNPAAVMSPQQRGLLKAWANATGPRTDEGKARAAANLEGHPTPEETKRTRLNAMKHGGYAQVASYFPAKPGRYSSCDSCEYFGDVCRQDPPKSHSNPLGCLKKAEVFIQHRVAFDSGDPSLLRDKRADTQAGLQVLIDEMILQIAQDGGPRIKEIAWYHDKEGEFHLARYLDGETHQWVQIYENKAHPLLKPLIDFVARNNLTLADMGMTPKIQQENELLAGHLQSDRDNKQDAVDFRERQQMQLEKLAEMIDRSQKDTERDPVLIEYKQGGGNG